jgi:hypothetical protein
MKEESKSRMMPRFLAPATCKSCWHLVRWGKWGRTTSKGGQEELACLVLSVPSPASISWKRISTHPFALCTHVTNDGDNREQNALAIGTSGLCPNCHLGEQQSGLVYSTWQCKVVSAHIVLKGHWCYCSINGVLSH